MLADAAAGTSGIGVIATGSTTYNDPFNLARRYLSLDHLAGGRAGWNVVTTQQPEASANFGYSEPPEMAERYRRADAGGQAQRVAIARALSLNPEIVILDEAVSALDVSVQAEILQLLVDLQAAYMLTYLFITHDLGVVRLIADTVTVMWHGSVVETGSAATILDNSVDEYTRRLVDSVPGTHLFL